MSEHTRTIRTFKTGATRDTDNGKHDVEGFNSALVDERFNEFMHKNRHQSDGTLREGDNWQKGMPKDAYVESLVRHVQDLRLIWDGYPDLAREDLETALCAIRFNASGLLYEVLQEKRESQGASVPRPE